MGGELRVFYRMQKTKDLHGVLLVAPARAMLEAAGWSEKKPDDLIFPILKGYDLSTPHKQHNAISSRNVLVNKYLKKIQQRAGAETNLSFHIARHSIAAYLYEQGYDIYTIKEVLGHANVRITEEYLRGFRHSHTDEAMRSLKL